MKRLLLLLAFISLTSGCATSKIVHEDTSVPEHKIVTYDPEKADIERYGPLTYESTPNNVVVAHKSGVRVRVDKGMPITDEDTGVDRELWYVTVDNFNEQDKCVWLAWRLLDFQMYTDEPSTFFIKAGEEKIIGTMLQSTMVVDGVHIAPPASGYVRRFAVLDPNIENVEEKGDECLFLAKKVIEESDDIIER